MLRKTIRYASIFAVALVCHPVVAETHNLAPNMSIDYKLPVDHAEEFVNHMFWSITATCTFHTEDESDDIFIKMLSKSGKINGNKINKGDVLTVTIHNNERMKISADSGAKVQLTNKGQHSINAKCST